MDGTGIFELQNKHPKQRRKKKKRFDTSTNDKFESGPYSSSFIRNNQYQQNSSPHIVFQLIMVMTNHTNHPPHPSPPGLLSTIAMESPVSTQSSPSQRSRPCSRNNSSGSSNQSRRKKPLPLKQRTSSIDQRRDYTAQTWISVLSLVKLREYVITVDHFPIWRRHLAWAIDDGKDLRDYITQRYASSMVFMSLLLSTELGILFNSAGVTTIVRQSLRQQAHHTVSFWAGIAIIISAVFTLLSLISTFTAWTMVSAISDVNAHCILRSSIGQYAAELPGRYIVGSIYSFLIWFCLFLFLLLPVGFYSYLLLLIVTCLFVHTITAFSAFGRVIMHTGAMGSTRIFDKEYESRLQPHSLHANLLTKAKANLGNKTSIIRQYRTQSTPIERLYSEDEMSGRLSFRSTTDALDIPPPPPVFITNAESQRGRSDSFVKFADGYNTNGDRFEPEATPSILDAFNTTNKSRNRNMPIDSTMPFTAPRRPPRQQHRSDDDEKTPLVTNQSTSSSADIVDRWIGGGVTRTDSNMTDGNDDGTVLTKDKHGHNRRISFDNPYLLFEDPTPFVPSIQQDDRRRDTAQQENSPHPFHRSSATTTEPTHSPRYRDNAATSNSSNNTYRLQYDMSSDDEALFNNDYGATDDDDDDNDSNNNQVAVSQFTPQEHSSDYYFENNTNTDTNHQHHHPLLAPATTSSTRLTNANATQIKSQGLSITTLSEQTRLIDDHQLERGDYNSTQSGL